MNLVQKRATFEYKKRFLHQSTYQLEDVYRALHILYQERYTIKMHYIKDLQNYIRAILMFYTTIVQIFTLKQKNQMNLDYMVLAKNIVPIQLFNMGCLWMVMGYL